MRHDGVSQHKNAHLHITLFRLNSHESSDCFYPFFFYYKEFMGDGKKAYLMAPAYRNVEMDARIKN